MLQTSTFLSAISPCLFNVVSAWSRSFVNSFISSSFSCTAASRARSSANAFSKHSRQAYSLGCSEAFSPTHKRLTVTGDRKELQIQCSVDGQCFEFPSVLQQHWLGNQNIRQELSYCWECRLWCNKSRKYHHHERCPFLWVNLAPSRTKQLSSVVTLKWKLTWTIQMFSHNTPTSHTDSYISRMSPTVTTVDYTPVPLISKRSLLEQVK